MSLTMVNGYHTKNIKYVITKCLANWRGRSRFSTACDTQHHVSVSFHTQLRTQTCGCPGPSSTRHLDSMPDTVSPIVVFHTHSVLFSLVHSLLQTFMQDSFHEKGMPCMVCKSNLFKYKLFSPTHPTSPIWALSCALPSSPTSDNALAGNLT